MRRRFALLAIAFGFAGAVACGLAITDQGAADSNAVDAGSVAETSTPPNEASADPGDASDAAVDAFEAGPCGLTMELLTRDAGDASIYCLDQTEVTEARYRKDFLDVDAEVIMPPGCAFKTSFNKGTVRDGGATKPVSDVDWCDAWAFCKLTGKRLCSAAEWQNACNGGIATRLYPYGETFDASVCNGGQFGAPTDPGQMAGCRSTTNLVDMSGNMDEWADNCLTISGPGDICYTHGGDWKNDSAGELMCLATYARSRSTVLDYVGFRCCKSL